MKQVCAIIFVVLILFCNVYSDTFDFDLRTFSPPDFSRSSLDVSAYLNSTRNFTDMRFNENESTSLYSGTIPTITLTYSHYSYSADHILDTDLSFRYELSDQSFDGESSYDYDTVAHSFTFTGSRSEQLYVSSSFFFTYKPYTAYTMRQEKQVFTDDSIEREYTAGMAVSFGVGRMHDVGNARSALFMYEDMHKYGILTSPPTCDDIQDLGALITTQKNNRFFDYRDHFVDTMRVFDGFFNAKTNITHTIDQTAAFTDIFFNLTEQSRLYGWQLYCVIDPSYTNKRAHNDDPTVEEIDYETQKGLLGIFFSYENPFSQKGQFSLLAEASLNAEAYDINELNEILQKEYRLRCTTTLSYYPDQRVSYYGTLIAQYSSIDYFERSMYATAYVKSYQAYCIIGAHYYISPKFTLSAEASNEYTYFDRNVTLDYAGNIFHSSIDDVQHRFYLTASCSYKLF